MPQHRLSLEPEKFYHIYNRGINGCPIFTETGNYEHFLRLYDKYISPVAQTYAWVLMGNHFHWLVRIKPLNLPNPEGFENLRGLKTAEKHINQQFSNLFNAYTKAFNKRYNRTGSLFEHTFRRKQITSIEYLKQVVVYIHNNPVHHKFCQHPIEYPWSSYLSCLSDKQSWLMRKAVMDWFPNPEGFQLAHEQVSDTAWVEKWLESPDRTNKLKTKHDDRHS